MIWHDQFAYLAKNFYWRLTELQYLFYYNKYINTFRKTGITVSHAGYRLKEKNIFSEYDIFYGYINIKHWTIEEHCNICGEKQEMILTCLPTAFEMLKGVQVLYKKVFDKHLLSDLSII